MDGIEDLDRRIDSLGGHIERVRREMTARQALHQMTSPIRTTPTTRLHDTVSTVSLSDQESPPPARPRAVTMDPSHTGGSESIRDKLEKMRARRQRKHQDSDEDLPTMGRRTVSAATTAVCIDSDDSDSDDSNGGEGEDFFESSRVARLFEEIDVPTKDLTWDKRVFYYHATSQTTDGWCIKDCRQECLNELLGGEVEDISEWLEEDEEGGDWADRSLDWSKDGFGYMEFRRLSNAMSPTSPAPPPPPMRKQSKVLLSRIMESDDPIDWEMVETPRGLKDVMDENKQLEWEIKRTRVAVAALTRLAIK